MNPSQAASVAHAQPAVDWDDGARDVGAIGTGQERNSAGNFFRLSHASKRNRIGDVGELIVGERRSHVGRDRTGCDDVDRDRS